MRRSRSPALVAPLFIALIWPTLAHSSEPNSEESLLQQQRETITRLIGAARCDDDAQCRVIGIGSRACGGPQSYAAWSSTETNEAELKKVVDLNAAAEAKRQQALGIMSTCVVLPVPGVACRRADGMTTGRGQCTLRQSPTGGAGVR